MTISRGARCGRFPLSRGFAVAYKNTHFVNQIFEKIPAWEPFKKVGQLTPEGVKFIEDKISNAAPLPFDQYIQ
jgi:hypothetical protein